MKLKLAQKLDLAVKLLEDNGYTIIAPVVEEESPYWRAIRTGIKPEIWPPIFMSQDELHHFRRSCGIPG